MNLDIYRLAWRDPLLTANYPAIEPNTNTSHVAAIIPFYQRSPGLLLRAVRSALGQTVGAPSIIVVDDGSPIPASEELSRLNASERMHITLLGQPNAGPGAARNRALSALPNQIEHVAFLDSDDRWTDDHLDRALRSFAAGAALYFTDYVRPNALQSAFATSRFPDRDCPEIGLDLHIYPDSLFEPLFRRAPVGTSTVVYRRALADELFPTKFHYGEDVFFWMLLARQNPIIAFSTRQEAVYGSGVNIAAAATWGNPSMQARVHSEYQFHQAVAATFPLDVAQHRWSGEYRAGLFETFIRHTVHLARRRHRVDWQQVTSMVLLEAKRRLGITAAMLK